MTPEEGREGERGAAAETKKNKNSRGESSSFYRGLGWGSLCETSGNEYLRVRLLTARERGGKRFSGRSPDLLGGVLR